MGKIIPWWSARKINEVGSYKRFLHTKAYIQQKSAEHKDSGRNNPTIQVLMEKCGYKKVEKFRAHRREWDNLERDIPLAYLRAIGVDLAVLKFTAKLDVEEYERALKSPLHPKCITVRWMAAVYSDFALPPETSETDAILFAQKFMREHKIELRCCIKYPDLKTIYIEPDGTVCTTYYRPSLRLTRTKAIFRTGGKDIGISRLR